MQERVLIVDDDPDVRAVWSAIAAAEGLEIIEAENGRQAIEILEHDGGFKLIILDIIMPGAGGYETLKRIRSVERLKWIPVIISTADLTTRGLPGIPDDDKTSFIHKAAGIDVMRRGVIRALGRSPG